MSYYGVSTCFMGVLFSPTVDNIVFYQVNNCLMSVSCNKMHKLRVAFAVDNDRCVCNARNLMAIHIRIKDVREQNASVFLYR